MNLEILSIVIPVFNEEKYIEHTLKRIYGAKTYDLKKEIIVVDDASNDNTLPLLKKLQKKYGFRLILQKLNRGKGAALKTGLTQTSGDIVLVQDADLEYSPQDYTTLLEPFLMHDADVVFGSRFISHRPHRVLYFWHSVGNAFLTVLSNMVTNLNLTDMETGSKVFKGTLIRKIAPHLESERFGFEPEVTARLAKVKNLKIYEVGISYSGRTYAEGKKIGWRDGIRAIFEIIKYNLIAKI